MATLTSTQERRSTGSVSATLLKLAPMLLAVALVGCTTKAQRIGSLSGDPSLAGTAGSSARAGGQGSAEPHAAATGGATAPQSGKSSSTAGAVGSDTADGAADGGASSSNDSAAGQDGAGGDQVSSLSGGAAGPGGGGGPGKSAAGGDEASALAGGTAATGRPGSPGSSRSSATTAAAGGSGKPGAAGGDGASAPTGRSAGAGRHAGPGGSTSADAGAGDLSEGGAVAGLESDAGGPGGRDGGTASRRTGGNASGTSDDRAGAGGAAAAGVEGDARIASIDVPSGNVKVDEEYRPQTLGGVLPLVLGVNEEGRFDFDQYLLRAEVKAILDELAKKLQTAEYDRLDIIGYTDRIGTVDYNRRLSELRAYAVAQYLMTKGVPQNKIHYEGRGEKDPLTPAGECQGLAREELITCLQKDRRVEIEASIHRKHATVVQ